MSKSNFVKVIIAGFLIASIVSCGGKDFKKTPLDNYIVENSNEKVFSVILEDMDVDGTFFKTYLHKYKVIKHKEDDTPYEQVSDWIEVSEKFFAKHEDNLGMVVLEKQGQGKISKVASPPGYGYVTNSSQTRKEKPNFFKRRASKSGWSSSRNRSGSRSRSTGFGK